MMLRPHRDHEHPRVARRAPERPDTALRAAATLFRAAGDEARLRLLERLIQRPWCVSDLAEASGEGMTTVSQRLRVLRDAGMVTRRRGGKHIFYSLADAHVTEMVRSALDHAAEPSTTSTPRRRISS
jgi:ArsR family transcriptional regulator, lead/cadmium/zinc/bismuth-responsive transcriptional repressor